MKNRSIYIVIIVSILSSSFNYAFAQNESDIMHSDVVLDSLTVDNDSIMNFKSKFNGYPYAFYSPETEIAVGGGGIYIFYTAKDSLTNPSKIGFGGYYSTLKNYKISINPALYYFENILFIRAPVSYGFFVDKYWGKGDDTPETGNEPYSRQDFSATLYIQSPPAFAAADRSGLVIDYNYTEIIERKENQFLKDSTLTGVNGGSILGIGFDLTWDSRDNIFFPNKGGYQYFKISYYTPIDYNYKFLEFEVDIKHFWAIKEDKVIAANFYAKSVSGNVPFYRLPALGGSKRMRGYFHGRYRDNFYATIQAEYRQYFWRKFGFVVFGGLGNVASLPIEYNFDTMKYSYGAGLRYLFNKKQKINLRMDIGIGQGGNTGIYFGIEEAF